MPKTFESSNLEAARAAKSQARKMFAALAPVTGVGLTKVGGVYSVKINLRNLPAPSVSLPKEINGVPVIVEVTGAVRKF
jgi:hypothetical protein